MGGETNPQLARLDQDELYKIVKKDLSSLLGIKDEPLFKDIKRWSNAIPLPDHVMAERKGLPVYCLN